MLWVCRKSQKISTASDQRFLSYVKKTTKGWGQIDPPAGIGLKVDPLYLESQNQAKNIHGGLPNQNLRQIGQGVPEL